MPLDPDDSDHIKKLRDSMDNAKERMKPWKERYKQHLEAVAGSRFGDTSRREEPLNFLKLAVRTYRRSLITKAPRVLVNSNRDQFHAAAYEFELGLNQALREAKVGVALKRAVVSAMLGVGVVKVGISPSTMIPGAESYVHDPGQAFVDHILFDDWLHDVRATCPEEWDWCGNRYRMPLQYVLENPMYSAAARERLGRSSKDETLSGEEGSNMVEGRGLKAEDYIDYVDLWDIWLPRENLLVTLADDESNSPLRVVEWQGPESGPYHILGFELLPGNTIPGCPAADLYDMHRQMNRILTKLFSQADRQKNIAIASNIAVNGGAVANIKNAGDGDVVSSDDPGAAKEMSLGGIDQKNLAFLTAVMEMASYAGGNVNSMAGLAPSADTLGQERILAESSNATLALMQEEFQEFAANVVRDFGWYVYHDPFLEINIAKTIPDTPVRIETRWSADRRQVDWRSFDVDIEPFSMRHRGPGERLQTIMQVLQVLSGFGPMMQQQGLTIDVAAIVRIIARYTDMDEISQFVTSGGMPLTRAPQPAGDAGAAPQLKMPGGREYIHKNVNASGGDQNPMMAQLQAMLQQAG